MIYLSSIRSINGFKQSETYPFNLAILKNFKQLTFNTPITYFVGENGTGKSTILEAIAAGINSITIGGDSIEKDETMASARKLGDQLRFSWKVKTHKGFYVRSEDVFGFHKYLEKTKKEFRGLADESIESDNNSAEFSTSRLLAGQAALLEATYGKNLDANSHGKTFLKIFDIRLKPGGLYLLDEPETPLSLKKQLQLLVMLQEMVKQNCQFIIATHSPILSALPGTTIYSFENGEIKKIDYKEIDQFNLMKDFLNNPEQFLKHLIDT